MLKNLLNRLLFGRPGTRRATAPAVPSEPPGGDAIEHAIREYSASNLACAQALAEQIVGRDPRHHRAWNLLGAIALAREDNEAAVVHFERAVALCPADPHYLSNCAEAFRRVGRLDDAEEYCRAALAADPQHAPAHHSLGLVQFAQGEIEGASVAYRAALAIVADFRQARSALLFLLCHHPDIDAATVFAEHCRWDEIHARALAPQPAHRAIHASPDRPLRIGYVSADFRWHSVSYFIEPLLAHHDPGCCEVHCYHNSTTVDEVTRRLRASASHWCDISALSDEAVARRISQDGIDVLVDLSGHTAGNRLLVFARKPAPLQASYLGYLNTTGLQSMDFRISDAYADPPVVSDALHTERLIRMPHCQWCYRPPANTPSVNSLPALTHGMITFGALHNLGKINRNVIQLWASLLLRCPGSELLLGGIPTDARAQRLREKFSAYGVDASRLQLISRRNFDEYWRLFHRIDVALDAFPYNGATTTCEALWMGIPVVTLAGKYAAARSGVSLLTNVGRSDLVANSPGHYIDIALGLAGDLRRLAALRATLRATMQQSPLMDEVGFVRAFETLIRDMVRQKAATGT